MEYGLIGKKLGHSFSREVHAAIADYPYELCELSEDGVRSLMETRSFRAINVTIPYKETVIPMLDVLSDSAAKIGAVNTIVNRNGKLYGYNTDYAGAAALLRHAGIDVAGKKVLLLGSGGTSKTLRAVTKDMGAGQILTVSRHPDGNSISYAEAKAQHTDAEILINTTPVGMFPDNRNLPIDPDLFPSLCGVLDVIYNPLSTNLVLRAKEKRIPAEGGLYMLAAQAVYASALFTGHTAEEAAVDQICRRILAEKRNIILIGMPSAGKSSVGRSIARQTNRPLFDTDEMVAHTAGKTIREIFEESGESAFRKMEAEAVLHAASRSGAVIATGGGTVLDPKNAEYLRQNGLLLFLNRSPALLTPTPDRPLSQDSAAMQKKYRERLPVYRALCDAAVPGDGTVEETAALALSAFESLSY